jgi:hypothetical protein
MCKLPDADMRSLKSLLGYNSPFEAALEHDRYTSKSGHQKSNAAFLWSHPHRTLKYVVGGD